MVLISMTYFSFSIVDEVDVLRMDGILISCCLMIVMLVLLTVMACTVRGRIQRFVKFISTFKISDQTWYIGVQIVCFSLLAVFGTIHMIICSMKDQKLKAFKDSEEQTEEMCKELQKFF